MKEEIVYLKVKDLRNNPNNPRKNDGAVDSVAKSIEKYGFRNPLIVDENRIVYCGNTRLKASRKLGLEEVPCIVVNDLTEQQMKELALLDNKTNEIAEWDFEMLDDILKDVELDDFEELDWGIGEEAESEKEVEEDGYIEPENLPTKTHLGEIWQLGNHRLMCGDSTKEEDVAKLMDGKLADLLFTDPPYNVNISNSQGMTIENDNMDTKVFREFLNNAFKNCSDSLKQGGAFYIWHADSETVNFREACEENELKVRQCLIWVKNGFNFGRKDYKQKHEPCLYGWKDGAAHYFVEEYNHPTVIEDKVDFKKLKKEELVKMLEEMTSEKIATTIIHEDKPLVNDLHPTMKPLRMCGELIRHSSRKKELVLDLFGGSGSTLIVCEQLDRQCYIMEYDPLCRCHNRQVGEIYRTNRNKNKIRGEKWQKNKMENG